MVIFTSVTEVSYVDVRIIPKHVTTTLEEKMAGSSDDTSKSTSISCHEMTMPATHFGSYVREQEAMLECIEEKLSCSYATKLQRATL